MITNHEFVPGPSGYCRFVCGAGPEREWCGCTVDRHGIIDQEATAALARNFPNGRAMNTPIIIKEQKPSLNTHESTKRVLFHLVNTYQTWRTGNGRSLGVPNEFTDDATRIGEQHLRLVNWFPEDEGWLANNTDTSPNDGAKLPTDSVLSLIDEELQRLREPVDARNSMYFGRRRRGWFDGLTASREVSARHLQKIRNAYTMELLVRETERLSLYDIEP